MLAPFTAFDEHIYTRRGRGIESPGSLVLNPLECRGFQGSEGIKQPGVFCLGGSDQSHQDGRITVGVVRGRRRKLMLFLSMLLLLFRAPERQKTGFLLNMMVSDYSLGHRQVFLWRTTYCTEKKARKTGYDR